MFAAYVVVSMLLAITLAGIAAADFTRHQQVLVNMAKAGVPESWLTPLGFLHAAGALGLLVGIRVPLVGQAAAACLVLFFVGAVIAHLRVREYTLAPAVALLLLSVAALVLQLNP